MKKASAKIRRKVKSQLYRELSHDECKFEVKHRPDKGAAQQRGAGRPLKCK